MLIRSNRGYSRLLCRILPPLVAALIGCVAAAAAKPPAPPGPTESSGDALRQIVADSDLRIAGGLATQKDRERLAQTYESDGHRLLWSVGGKPTVAALALIDQLRLAADRGLDPADYDAAELIGALGGGAPPGRVPAGPSSAAPAGTTRSKGSVPPALADDREAEVMPAASESWPLFDAHLTLAAARFLSDLHFGRIDPASVGHNLGVEHAPLDIPAALARLAGSAGAADVPAQLDAIEPPFIHYALLKKALARYRSLASDPGINALPRPSAKSVKPNEAYAGAAQLQRLLVALGDLPATSPAQGSAAIGAAAVDPAAAPAAEAPGRLTPALVQGIKHFQARHGETPDGALGAATYGELTKPLATRVRQIELTMERWRWLPAIAAAPIIVNIPQFRLYAFETTADREARTRQMDVIVGKSFDKTQTPVFAADMSYVIFRPYWEVPYSIAVKEIVPAARKDRDYIGKHQMEIVRGAGDAAEVMPDTLENVDLVAKGALRLRQKPGPDNSLGLVKFMLPNPYNVYLHSTPAQSLFSQTRRDFSHGCVRVSDPVGLAEYVLRDSPDWTRERIEAAMNGDKPVTVTLKKKIRVFIVYGTALAREQGDILFFDDIYGHDARLEKALGAKGLALRDRATED